MVVLPVLLSFREVEELVLEPVPWSATRRSGGGAPRSGRPTQTNCVDGSSGPVTNGTSTRSSSESTAGNTICGRASTSAATCSIPLGGAGVRAPASPGWLILGSSLGCYAGSVPCMSARQRTDTPVGATEWARAEGCSRLSATHCRMRAETAGTLSVQPVHVILERTPQGEPESEPQR